ncbi:MAG: hypothetical protein JST81_00715 [Bacteroidetes bacterium]|nr:hypothetical protein [Bacteroidota bacterium]
MINRNKLYKNNGKQQVNEASFNSMSQEKQPASPPSDHHRQLQAICAKQASMQQQATMLKSVIDDSTTEKNEKELAWMNSMYLHIITILPQIEHTKKMLQEKLMK